MFESSKVPVITVVIPTYDRAETVLTAVSSVLEQGVADVEVIVVDDGSTDDTAAVLSACTDSRLRVVPVPHCGRGNARNHGAALARAPWLTFLDSDDRALDGWLGAFVDGLSGGALLASSGARFAYPDGSSRVTRPTPQGPAFGSVSAQFLAGTFAVDAEVFRAVGGYLPNLDYGENTELGMRLGTEVAAREGTASADDRPLLEVSAVHRRYDAERLYSAGVLTLGAASGLLNKDPTLHASYLAIAGVAASRTGRGREARRLLRHAWRVQPTNWRHPARLIRACSPIEQWR
jgi:glycosyltransferase involved in cell wall biosynthesis